MICLSRRQGSALAMHTRTQDSFMDPGIPRTVSFHTLPAIFTAVIIAFALSGTAAAQWLNYKTPGIPRTADGKPDLSAPAPKMADGKPDLSGIWRFDAAGFAETGKAQDT